jgi:putative transposase
MTVLLTKTKLESVYRNESDIKVKERLLLVLKVKNDGMVPACAARELYRSRTWASDWLRRYHEEGMDGLEDRHKSGRPSEISNEISLRIRRNLKEE